MDLAQRRQQLRQKQVEKVKKFRQSNQSASDAASDAVEKRNEREQMKKEIKKELSQESINIENSDGTTFARVMNIIGPTHMRPVVSGGLWKGTEQITEKKSDCECDDCGQDPCIECGESHHSVKEAKVEAGRSDYGKASVRNKRRFGKEGEPAIFDASGERGKMIDKRREEHKAKRGVKEDYYSGTGEKVVARTKKWMDKKGQKGAPGLDAMKSRAAEHKAKRGVKEEIELKEYSPNVVYQAKGGKKSGKLGKSSVYSIRGKDESKKDFRKSHVKDIEGGYVGKGHKPTPGSLRKEQMEKDNGVDDQQQKQIDSKQKKADQIKKQVLLKKLQAVRAGGGSEIVASYDWRSDDSMRINKIFEGKKKGLWDNIHAKRKRGEKPAKPGDKDYPKTLDVDEGLKQARKNVGADTCWDGYKAKGTKKKGGKEVPNCVKEDGVNEGAAWTKKSGKSASGGLNEKGRKSYERENPGSDLKAPQPEGGSRKKSFCARMGGMKKKLTSSKTANDPDSRINKALRKWKC